MPLPPVVAGSGTDSIAVGVHVGGDRQAISQHFCTTPEFPPAINGITRRPVPDATIAIDATSRSFGDFRFWHIAALDVCDGTSAVGESRHRIPGASVTEPCFGRAIYAEQRSEMEKSRLWRGPWSCKDTA
jgi:hypothetical protein